jgi:hypothetical protein
VQVFQQAGAVTWWFWGPEDRARQHFEVRGTGLLTDFDRQLSLIHEHHAQLAAMTGVHRLKTLRDDGSFLPLAHIWQAIQPSLPNFPVKE